MKKTDSFDVIVVGAGHAGIEACLATSRLGLSTLVLTTNLDRIGYMSCNPSIGGLAKGHMVREIDILGGQMGIVADQSCLQYKRLNSGRGPAVRGTRMQCDKVVYSRLMTQALGASPNLVVKQGEVKRLLLDGNRVCGVEVADGGQVGAKAVIITAGTFLNGVMHIGEEQTEGGRIGDQASRRGLSDQLRSFGFEVFRLKTGTPPRLRANSVDWAQLKEEHGDPDFFPFSLRSPGAPVLKQVNCYSSRTTEVTHQLIRDNLHLSPMYSGIIEGVGPRYCPSIEDKVVRFGDRDSHQTFLEPESLETDLIYLQGISTSLPKTVQDQFIKSIPGLQNVEIVRYGYAVEYDFFEPRQIFHRLETRPIEFLFLAGQINGTSGYEEAAAQGLIAGINCARRILGQDEFVLGRHEAYIGVLIDDLVTKGTREPYRMFTSRAEHRLVLREDNTLDRLADRSKAVGLSDELATGRMLELKRERERTLSYLGNFRLKPGADLNFKLHELGLGPLNKVSTGEEFLRRPEIGYQHLLGLGFDLPRDHLVADSVEIEIKYKGYVDRQNQLIEMASKSEAMIIPDGLDYEKVKGLSNEEKEKLARIRPRTLGQAGRVSGVNPSAIQTLMIYLRTINLREGNVEQ